MPAKKSQIDLVKKLLAAKKKPLPVPPITITDSPTITEDNHPNRSDHFNWKEGDLNRSEDLIEDFKMSRRLGPVASDAEYSPGEEDASLSSAARAHYLERHKSLRPEQKQAVTRYKDDSKRLNRPLRHGEQPAPKVAEAIQYLKAVTRNSATPEDHVVYRGFDRLASIKPNSGIEDFKKGDVYKDHGFTGTTFNRQVAIGFARNSPEHGRTIAKIHIPKGTRAHYIDVERNSDDSLGREKELLLHPGTKFKILGHSVHTEHVWNEPTRVHVVHMKVVNNRTKRG